MYNLKRQGQEGRQKNFRGKVLMDHNLLEFLVLKKMLMLMTMISLVMSLLSQLLLLILLKLAMIMGMIEVDSLDGEVAEVGEEFQQHLQLKNC